MRDWLSIILGLGLIAGFLALFLVNVTCYQCDGAGRYESVREAQLTCPRCKGRKELDGLSGNKRQCLRCRGAGKITDSSPRERVCEVCEGNQRLQLRNALIRPK